MCTIALFLYTTLCAFIQRVVNIDTETMRTAVCCGGRGLRDLIIPVVARERERETFRTALFCFYYSLTSRKHFWAIPSCYIYRRRDSCCWGKTKLPCSRCCELNLIFYTPQFWQKNKNSDVKKITGVFLKIIILTGRKYIIIRIYKSLWNYNNRRTRTF